MRVKCVGDDDGEEGEREGEGGLDKGGFGKGDGFLEGAASLLMRRARTAKAAQMPRPLSIGRNARFYIYISDSDCDASIVS